MTSTDTGSATSTLDENVYKVFPYEFGSIDASGNVTSKHINASNFKLHTITFTIADISNNAVMRMEGCADTSGNRWFNMSVADLTVTANGTYQISEFGAVLFIRAKYVSRSTALVGRITNVAYYGR